MGHQKRPFQYLLEEILKNRKPYKKLRFNSMCFSLLDIKTPVLIGLTTN